MVPAQRPATLSGLVVLILTLGAVQVFFGALFLALSFPFPAYCGFVTVLGVLNFVAAVGLHTMRTWAWTAAAVLGVLSAIVTFPVGTVFAILLLAYLFKPELKAAFGAGPPIPPPLWGMAPPYVPAPWEVPPQYAAPGPPTTARSPDPNVTTTPPPTGPPPRSKFCRNCGYPLDPDTTACPACGARG